MTPTLGEWKNMYRKNWSRYAGLIILLIVFELLSWISGNRLGELTVFEWIMLAFAASFIGRAVSYMAIFEWLRVPFGKEVLHSSGVGETVEPVCNTGFWSALCSWITCPICSTTWAGAGLLLLYLYFPHLGKPMLYLLSAASLGAIVIRVTEIAEWGKYLAWEHTGRMNRINRVEEATLKIQNEALKAQLEMLEMSIASERIH